MPRCYMVKKALCNKYMSVARGFESWGRAGRENSPSPTAMQLLVSPIEPCTALPVSQECLTSQVTNQASSEAATIAEQESTPAGVPPAEAVESSYADSRSPDSAECPSATRSPASPAPKSKSHCRESLSPENCTRVEETKHVSTVITTTTTTTTPARSATPPIASPETSPTTRASRRTRSKFTSPHSYTGQPVAVDDFSATPDERAAQIDRVQPAGDIVAECPESSRRYTRLCERNESENVLQSRLDVGSSPTIGVPRVETSMFRDRSAAETEAAHDLLELSRSLPPLAPPSIAIGPQTVIETPTTDNNVQEISIYQPARPTGPIYQLNTIELGSGTTTVYQQPASGIMYDPVASTTIVQQTSTGVFIPLSPVQEILFTYASAPSGMPSIITSQPVEPPALTPPASECSSDIENNNPNSQPPSQRDKEVQTITEQAEVKAASYTYDTLLVADGRSKNKKQPSTACHQNPPSSNLEVNEHSSEATEAPKTGRYVCCECGKQYATSSNLSRHKQTHRSIDSQSAKKCIHCGKAYVSMPALAMHVLTHKLTHSCGVCGKMFSRPWLLQGHLRSHTGEKPYGCAHCGKAFADRSNLRAHMQTHSSDKNYECPKCHKSFALKSYLNKHLESACQRDNCDENSFETDIPGPYGPVSSSNNSTSENEPFSRIIHGVNEERT